MCASAMETLKAKACFNTFSTLKGTEREVLSSDFQLKTDFSNLR
jgi:hypothetical protein